MSESKKKKGKVKKGKPPLISDVKGVIKSFIGYEDDECLHLKILISSSPDYYRTYRVAIKMGNTEAVRVNDFYDQFEDSGTEVIFKKNQTVSESVFEEVFGIVKGAMLNLLDTITRPKPYNPTHKPYRLLDNKKWKILRGYECYVPIEEFALFAPKLERAIESAMDSYSKSEKFVRKIFKEQRKSTSRMRGGYEERLPRIVNLFYKICKPQPRGVGLLKLALGEDSDSETDSEDPDTLKKRIDEAYGPSENAPVSSRTRARTGGRSGRIGRSGKRKRELLHKELLNLQRIKELKF